MVALHAEENEREKSHKGAEVFEIVETLKNSMDHLAISTNRLSEVLQGLLNSNFLQELSNHAFTPSSLNSHSLTAPSVTVPLFGNSNVNRMNSACSSSSSSSLISEQGSSASLMCSFSTFSLDSYSQPSVSTVGASSITNIKDLKNDVLQEQ